MLFEFFRTLERSRTRLKNNPNSDAHIKLTVCDVIKETFPRPMSSSIASALTIIMDEQFAQHQVTVNCTKVYKFILTTLIDQSLQLWIIGLMECVEKCGEATDQLALLKLFLISFLIQLDYHRCWLIQSDFTGQKFYRESFFRMLRNWFGYILTFIYTLLGFRTPSEFEPSFLKNHDLLLQEYFPSFKLDFKISSFFRDMVDILESLSLVDKASQKVILVDLIYSLKLLSEEAYLSNH